MAAQLGDEVAVGAGGMLFHRFDWAFEQVCGEMPFPVAQQQRWTALVLNREALCHSLGATFVAFVVPERHAVYSERLPDEARLNPRRPVVQLRHAFEAAGSSSLFYPRQTLRATSHYRQTFHLTDQHMTDDGAYACYRAMADRYPKVFGSDIVLPAALRRSTSRLVGDLGIRLDDEADEATDYLHLTQPRSRKVATARLPVGRIDVYEQDDTTLPRAVWFGDSHAFSLLPFVAEHFSRLVMVQTPRFLTDLVEAERPDFVVSQTSETQIAYPTARNRLGTVRLPEDGGTTGLRELYEAGRLHRRAQTFLAVEFGSDGNSADYCERGWSAPELMQRWSEGAISTLLLPAPPVETNWELSLDAHPFFVATRHEMQRLAIVVGGATLAAFELTTGLHATVAMDAETLAAATDENGLFRLEFHHPDAASPADFGGADTRCLGLCFRKLSIQS